MSHFCVLVLSKSRPENLEAYCEDILAPYSEHIEVPIYKEDCWCIGGEALEQVNAQLEKEFPSIEEIRKTYWDEFNTLVLKKVGREYCAELAEKWEAARGEIEKTISPSWDERIGPRLARKEELLDQNPLKNSPDSQCEECRGSGKKETTYNPKSKWDWWQVGGRWNGFLNPEYKPENDPQNFEDCFVCKGSGLRNDELGRQQREKDPTYKCNGCNGAGRRLKWPTAWAWPGDGGNLAPVSEILRMLDEGHDLIPFALVRPSGEWLERGEMGWWAVVTNEKDNWKRAARSILEEYNESWAIVVDCHI